MLLPLGNFDFDYNYRDYTVKNDDEEEEEEKEEEEEVMIEEVYVKDVIIQ